MSEQLFRRTNDTLSCDVGGDVVALNVQRGQCYGMEKVTARVWELLIEPIGIGGICERLVEVYDVEPGRCRRDIEQLIDRFLKEGLVECDTAAL